MPFQYNVGLKINDLKSFKAGLSLQEFYLVAYRDNEIEETTGVHNIIFEDSPFNIEVEDEL
jgi:hypothetical protein